MHSQPPCCCASPEARRSRRRSGAPVDAVLAAAIPGDLARHARPPWAVTAWGAVLAPSNRRPAKTHIPFLALARCPSVTPSCCHGFSGAGPSPGQTRLRHHLRSRKESCRRGWIGDRLIPVSSGSMKARMAKPKERREFSHFDRRPTSFDRGARRVCFRTYA